MQTKKETPKPKRLKIVGWDNDPDCSEFTFARFEDDPPDKFLPNLAQEKAIRWLDNLLDGTSHFSFSLISRLNDIQCECNLDKNPPPFPNKFAMPLGIVNLLVKEFGLTIEED